MNLFISTQYSKKNTLRFKIQFYIHDEIKLYNYSYSFSAFSSLKNFSATNRKRWFSTRLLCYQADSIHLRLYRQRRSHWWRRLRRYRWRCWYPIRRRKRSIDSFIITAFYQKFSVAITGSLTGVPVGTHGFHVHQNGALTNQCGDTGSHFQVDASKEIHGTPNKPLGARLENTWFFFIFNRLRPLFNRFNLNQLNLNRFWLNRLKICTGWNFNRFNLKPIKAEPTNSEPVWSKPVENRIKFEPVRSQTG